jgi:hypothetical protein
MNVQREGLMTSQSVVPEDGASSYGTFPKWPKSLIEL